MNTEPAITAGTITAIAAAIIAVLVAFAVPLTDTQQTAILGLIGVLAPIILMLIVRPAVTPNSKVAALRESSGNLVAGEAATQANGVPVAIHDDRTEAP